MRHNNVERYIDGTVHYFKLIGFEFEQKHRWMEFGLIAGMINMCFVLFGQLIYVPFADIELQERTAGISYMNYFVVSIGKIIAWLYNKKAIYEALNEFRRIYPSVQLEKAYNLQTYLKQYLLIERVLVGFFQSITLFFTSYSFLLSLVDLLKTGVFSYRMAMITWYPIAIRDNWLGYTLAYTQQFFGSYESAIIILASDLCLFSSVLQLCMNFDLINKKILEIEPDASDKAEKKLKILIVYQQRVLRLAGKINTIFTPSVLFSLLSSSFIICFTGYQLLGDTSTLSLLKVLLLLPYEMKQVIITCFLCDRLTEVSLKTADAIYEHNWYNGTPKYRRMVLIVLMHSQKKVALNIAGITDISRQTLREVMSVSYKIFTVLKTA